MTPARHDYLPDVIAARRLTAARNETLAILLVLAACNSLLALLCALVPLPLAYFFGVVITLGCVLGFHETARFLRLRRALRS